MLLSSELESKTNEELFSIYRETKEEKLKQELVIRYSYIVKTIAMQMRGVYVSFTDIEDMINEGIIALMGAIDKFDASKNVKFESYASLRIRGTIIDIARKQDWVPRSVRKIGKDIDKAYNELFSKLARYPKDKEIADYLGMSLDKYLKALGDTNLYHLLSLDTLMDSLQTNFISDQLIESQTDHIPARNLERNELSEILNEAVKSLREKEQLVVSLYYRKELSMKEISRVMDVSEPRISQIHAAALRKLRLYVENYFKD
ncbi:sigma-70 family RNA polymerase sigma factor [Anaerovorax odorimutans]|uniref:sigma-70 family RNA polymerase sigma factor n=1 Tax=Anaerovorax odorimutans TaxID=109327 RepID=UPI0003F80376|nr:FliA/WhiG family RNA polymerase sigma factor [Anaerovorax odorimutans]